MHFSRVNLQRDGVRKKCTGKSHCSVDILGAREKLKPATRGVWDWKWEMHSSCQRNKGGLWEASHGQAALERQQAQGEEKRGVLWSPEGEGAVAQQEEVPGDWEMELREEMAADRTGSD